MGPVDSRKERGEVNVKSTNERRLEEELALMKREKEDMQRMIEQMRDVREHAEQFSYYILNTFFYMKLKS